MKKLFYLLLSLMILIGAEAHAAVLVFSPNGTYITKPTLAAAATAADAAGKTVVVTSPQTLTANLVWPSDRALKFERGGYIVPNAYALTGLKEARPEWWGAKHDGMTDYTSAMQSAINSGAGKIVISDGIFVFDQVQLRSNLKIVGNGKGKTIIKRKSGSSNSLFYWSGNASNRLRSVSIEDLSIDGTDSTISGAGIYVNYFGRSYTAEGETLSQSVNTVVRCEIYNFAYGAYVQWGDSFAFNDCDIHHNGKGVYANNSANLVTVTGGAVHHNTYEGVLIANVSSNCTVLGCDVNDNGGYGVRVYVAEQPSILYSTFNRNGMTSGNNAIYLEGYFSSPNTFLTEAATIEGCIFGANSGSEYDIAATYVEGLNLRNNYFYNITEGKTAFIRLGAHTLGADIAGNRWKASTGVTIPIKVSAATDAIYTLNDSGDATRAAISMTGLGVISTPVAVSVVSGVVDCSAVKADFVRVGILSGNVTSILFPASPIDGQKFKIRFKQASSGGPYTVAGWPANVTFNGATFVKSPVANSQEVLSFTYLAGQSEWLESSGRSFDRADITNNGPPSTTPAYFGQGCWDYTNGKWYKAKGTGSSADWVILN